MCSAPSLSPTAGVTSLVVEQLWQPVPGGSGTYILELARELARMSAPLVGIAASHPDSPSPQELGLPRMPVHRSRLLRPALYESWNWLGHPRAEALAPESEVVHATTWAIPPTRLPLAVTVHDLAFLRAPEHFTRRGSAYFRRALQRTVREAQRVIVPSKATADDCLEAGIAADRIRVIPHGVRTQPVSEQRLAQFRSTYGLTRDYVLWTGTHEPRKNLPALLAAFDELTSHTSEIDLVLVGPAGWGDGSAEQRLVAALGERAHVLGRLSDADLAAAYSGARAFCFPSLWEGFGLPVLEAMAYGVPVVTSRGTCMEEVCGEAGLLAEASDPREIANQLLQAVGHAHDELAVAGLERAARFTWQASAQAHAAVYQELAS